MTETPADPVRARAVDAAMAVFKRRMKSLAPHRRVVEAALNAAGEVYDADHDAAVQDMMDRSLMVGMDVGPDGLTLKAITAREIAVNMALAAAQFLDEHPGAENYVQQDVWDEARENRYTIIFMRPGGRTPHELRQAAEAERDQLRVERDWLLAEADDDTRARFARARPAEAER